MQKEIETQQSSSVLRRPEGELIGQHFQATYAAVQESCIPIKLRSVFALSPSVLEVAETCCTKQGSFKAIRAMTLLNLQCSTVVVATSYKMGVAFQKRSRRFSFSFFNYLLLSRPNCCLY